MTSDQTERTVQHTTGPWRVEDIGLPDSLAIMAADRDGHVNEYRWIASVSIDEERDILLQEAEANAALISAAPSLYAALKALVTSVPCGQRSAEVHREWLAAEDAVAQAEGVTQP